jgi:DNA-binding response OmpR family regulator
MTDLRLGTMLDKHGSISLTDVAEHRRAPDADTPILVVEDDPHVRMCLRLVLEHEGYDVVAAADGGEALQAIRRVRPCIVLLDLELPVVCGELVAAEVRDIHGGGGPLIVLSAASDGHLRAERVGADRYLAKPFDVDALVTHVAEAVGA